MVVNSERIVENLKIEKDDIDSLNAAIEYLNNNFNMSIESPEVYRDYLVNVYQIIHCLKFEDSITWWGQNLLIQLQSLSITKDNIIAKELIRRYLAYRNVVLQYIGIDELEDIIESLPSFNDESFNIVFYKLKENSSKSKKIFDAILNMKSISDQTKLGLNAKYVSVEKPSTKVKI